jgi:hypothetical protein
MRGRKFAEKRTRRQQTDAFIEARAKRFHRNHPTAGTDRFYRLTRLSR